MMKVGLFQNNSNGRRYVVVINSVQGKGERIELYNRSEDYSVVDTYNAIGAYYRKYREYTYGDSELIRDYLKTYNKCLVSNGVLNETNEFTSEGFVLTQQKSNESLGIHSKLVMVNGSVTEEEYKTPEFSISVDINKSIDSNVFSEPLNIRDYKEISILTDIHDSDSVNADYYSLDYLKSKYPLDHIEDYNYTIVHSLEEGKELLKKWSDAPVKLKSVDIESTGLGVTIFGEDLITGVILSYDWTPLGEVENSVYFPFRQSAFEYNLPIEFIKEIADAINAQPKAKTIDPTINDGVLILAHVGKMERKAFMKESLNIRIDVDTYVLSMLIDTRMVRGLHTLKSRAQEATNLFWIDLDLIFKSKIIRFDILPEDIVRYYACPDTANTIKVFKYLFKKLPPAEWYVFEIDNELQEAKTINEYYGLRLDQEALIKRLENVEHITATLADLFKSIHRTSKNINSADVLRDIIYVQLGCPVVVRTKKNKPSSSADAIQNIVEHGELQNVDLTRVPPDIMDLYKKEVVIKGVDLKSNRYPSLVILASYNKYKKELGALRRLQKKSVKGRVMFGINGNGAASWRQTSDAHQYSSVMKELVLSDTPFHNLVSADYSQVELRVLAYIIQDERLIKQMFDKHIDIHRAFLSIITGIPIHMISAVMRSNGKRVNFGVVYGISEFGLARDKYGPSYTHEQLLESKTSITDFFNGIPGCKDLAEYNRKFVFEHGYIETAFHYRRYFYNVFDDNLSKADIERIFRAANNTPVQGVAAGIMKLAENNLNKYIKNKGWDKTITYMGGEFPLVRVMLSIHDEVLISAHESIPNEEIVIMTKECMEIVLKDAPPFFAVPTFIDNWLQGKSDKYEIPITLRDDIIDAWNDGKRSIVNWDNLVLSINEFKLKQIREYMNELIFKYKTVEEVIKNVTHPEYTHLLIAVYVDKDFVYKNSHADCIAKAVTEYMNNPDNIVKQSEQDYTEYNEDSSIQDSLSYLKEFNEFIEVDDKGEAIINEDIDTDDIDSMDYATLVDNEGKERFVDTKIGITYLGNIALIDTSFITDLDRLKSFHSRILEFCSPTGYYQLNYMRNGAMLTTNLKMAPNQKSITKVIEEYSMLEVK